MENILEKISEQDVADWMAAKLADINKRLPCTDMAFDMGKSGMTVTLHHTPSKKCVVLHKTVANAERELAQMTITSEAEQAREKRNQAARLLAQAIKIEKRIYAQTKTAKHHEKNTN